MTGRRYGPRALADTVAAVTKPIFGRRGFADGAVVRDWTAIVGDHLAAHCVPERIVHPRGKSDGGTLHLRVDGGSLAMELQHLQGPLMERVNTYFGYRAVGKVRIVQGPVPSVETVPVEEPRQLDADQEGDLARRLEGIDDPDLRAALEGLGRSMMARKR
jgi:hypothetical protein